METYILPAHWAPALINGDESGMEESEINEMNDWLERTNPGYCTGCSDESYFKNCNDAGTLPCDVLIYTFTH